MSPKWVGALAACAALALFGCRKSSSSTSVALVSAAHARWAQQLLVGEQADWREAQLLLAREAPASLAALEPVAAGEGASLERVTEVVELALRWNTSVEELRAWPTLWALAGPHLSRAAAALRDCEAAEAFEPELGWAEQASRLGGWAVPEALRLTRLPNPVARAWGVRVLGRLVAPVAAERLAELVADRAPVRLHGAAQGTVAALASQALQRLAVPADRPWLEWERQVAAMAGPTTELTDAIRDHTAAAATTTWDGYWAQARAVWRAWWQQVPEGGRQVPDHQVWLNHFSAREGFEVDRAEADGGQGWLTVVGPPGVTAVLSQNGRQVAAGPLPLTLDTAPAWLVTQMVAVRADGRQVAGEVRFDRTQVVTVRVLP